jgi:hypothetical protein
VAATLEFAINFDCHVSRPETDVAADERGFTAAGWVWEI